MAMMKAGPSLALTKCKAKPGNDESKAKPDFDKSMAKPNSGECFFGQAAKIAA